MRNFPQWVYVGEGVLEKGPVVMFVSDDFKKGLTAFRDGSELGIYKLVDIRRFKVRVDLEKPSNEL